MYYQVRNYCEDCVSFKYTAQSVLDPGWKAAGCESHTVRDFTVLSHISCSCNVIDRYDPTPGLPGSPNAGDSYISTATANGWTDKYIYFYDGTEWEEAIPYEGKECWVQDEDHIFVFSGSTWYKSPDSINSEVEKGTPVNADFVLIEDSEDTYKKKKAQLGNLPTGGGGEANTASNVGAGGVGVYKTKTGVDLKFKNINAGSSKVTITDDTGNDEVDVDVSEGNITHDNLSGAGTNTHAQIDTHLASTSNPHSVDKADVSLGNVENLKVNLNASTDPTVDDDSGSGYSVGSRWINISTDKEFVCSDASSGAAVWTETTAGAGGGEANTASNVGTGGVGVYKTKVGVDLRFKKINAGSNKITITDDTGNDEVDVDVSEGNIDHQNLSGAGTNDHSNIDTHLGSTSNPHSTSIANVGSGTLTELNTAVSDATLDDASNPRTPSTHATSHENGGGDEVAHDDLSGAGSNTHAQIDTHLGSTSNPHSTSIANMGGGTLAELNTAVSDATLDDSSDPRTDNDAIHDNVSGEISLITEKGTPVSADLLVIEDSAAANAKKRIQIGNLPSGGGEVNTASNVGTGGVGVYKTKVGVDLRFKKINAGSNKITITDDTGNDEVDVDVSEANIDHGSIDGLDDDDHSQYHNDTRGDARYFQKSEFLATSAGAGDSGKPIKLDADGNVDASMINDGDIDHTNIGSIGTNTHAQIDTHLGSTSNPHSTSIANVGGGTLAELNTAVSDATLDDSSSSRTPSAHATSHEDGGGDVVAHDDLSGAGTNSHAQIDTHIGSTSNPHSTSIANMGGGTLAELNTAVSDATLDDSSDPRTDDDAVHDNVSGEISAITEKVSPVGADVLLIEDSAASNAKKKVQITNLPGGADADAIHDNVDGEISLITEKGTPVSADLILIEDSASSNAKKRVQVGNLPGGSGEVNTASNVGTGGVGVYKEKIGVDLRFKKVNAGSSKITVTDDTGNDEVDIDVAEGNVVHDNLSGTGTNTHAQIDTHLASTSNPHSTSIANIGSGTLTELNTAVSDATLDDSSDPRTDNDAIHDNVANEISGITEKSSPSNNDVFVIEDSAASYVKKKVLFSNISSGGGPTIKTGKKIETDFTGNPKKATVTFTTPFSDANYSISVLAADYKDFIYESKAAGSFVINANSNSAPTGDTLWIAIEHSDP